MTASTLPWTIFRPSAILGEGGELTAPTTADDWSTADVSYAAGTAKGFFGELTSASVISVTDTQDNEDAADDISYLGAIVSGMGGESVGFVGLRAAFVAPLRHSRTYHYVNPETIAFAWGNQRTLSWRDLESTVTFELRDNPMSEAVAGLLSGAIVNLSIVLGIFTLLLFPALVFLIVRPLRAISTHIDRLKDSPGGLVLEDLAGPWLHAHAVRRLQKGVRSRLARLHVLGRDDRLEPSLQTDPSQGSVDQRAQIPRAHAHRLPYHKGTKPPRTQTLFVFVPLW